MTDTTDALATVVRFCDTYEAMSGRTDDLQGLHVGTAREVILRISDLRALAAENARLRELVASPPIKPLVWAETNNRPPTFDTGMTPWGRWRVSYHDDQGWYAVYGHALIVARDFFGLEAAKAAAQQDYESRIRAALATPPSP